MKTEGIDQDTNKAHRIGKMYPIIAFLFTVEDILEDCFRNIEMEVDASTFGKYGAGVPFIDRSIYACNTSIFQMHRFLLDLDIIMPRNNYI